MHTISSKKVHSFFILSKVIHLSFTTTKRIQTYGWHFGRNPTCQYINPSKYIEKDVYLSLQENMKSKFAHSFAQWYKFES